jgi:hypothetical protein
MTEAEWLACTDSQPMLAFLWGKACARKLRLFAVACCRRIARLLPGQESSEAVLVLEGLADGNASPEQVNGAMAYAARRAGEAMGRTRDMVTFHAFKTVEFALYDARSASDDLQMGMADVTRLIRQVARPFPEQTAAMAVADAASGVWKSDAWKAAFIAEGAAQAGLLRCIFGNPFRSVTLDPAWLSWHGGLPVSIARRMYDSRDFSDMPVLADALEEAGCRDAEILGHCRSGGEHVRGCWVVDLLLGKT